ncbi:MAG: hypothetical protein AB2809_15925 [Candidatus Thiodiazotropha sp.]
MITNGDNRLWNAGVNAPLMFIVPGGSGTGHPQKRGFDALASYYFLKGWTAFISEVGGQNGRPGKLSLRRQLEESRNHLDILYSQLSPSKTVFLGASGGAVVAAVLAGKASTARALVMWEPHPYYSNEDQKKFIAWARNEGVPISDTFEEEVIHLMEVASSVTIPAMLCHSLNYPTAWQAKVKASFSSTINYAEQQFQYHGHRLPKNGPSCFLSEFLRQVDRWLHSLNDQLNKKEID